MNICGQDHLLRLELASGDVNPDLVQLHDMVVRRRGRIELAGQADGDVSVLISKHELDAVERALEILSDTSDVRAMRDELARIAALSANPV